ncbi:IS6 family transposase [Rhodococcus sp. MS16]|uniref:IS6 family transposase n=1 Tax=Rhodococcus sp. MS16 TaxID=2579941 RepID=UPI0015625D44|nr:IS6 family transposase [Rhodococcus sp. MS16]NRI67656.1 IS6 family transposase [Rhodococcus sp. MS16]
MSRGDETRVDSTRSLYKRHPYPAEIIAHCVWLYYRFTLSLRDVAELMLARGIVVSQETIRVGCAKFGAAYARGLRRRAPEPGDTWFWTRCSPKIGGIRKYLWRAVDQDGNVFDVLVQSRRNAKAAKRFVGKLMRKHARVPRALVTDKLASYVVAHRELMPSVEHRRPKYLNNRAENSHQPNRQRERAMKFFRLPGAAQRSLAAFSAISPHFRPGRHKLTASNYRSEMTDRFATWNNVTAVSAA